MAPKKAVHHLLNGFKAGITFILLFLGELGSRLICKFYLLLGQQIAEGFHALFQLTFNLLLEVTKIVLVLTVRLLSEICFGVALVLEKILAAILHLILRLILLLGTFINQAAQVLVDQAGYGISCVIFVAFTILVSRWLAIFIADIHSLFHQAIEGWFGYHSFVT